MNCPEGFIFPILLAECSVNQMLPDESTATAQGWLLGMDTSFSSKLELDVANLPILFTPDSANHTFPRAVQDDTRRLAVGRAYVFWPKTPLGVRLLILPGGYPVNQTRLLESMAMPPGLAIARGNGELLEYPVGVDPPDLVAGELREP